MSPGNETLKRANQLDSMLHKKTATNSSKSGKRKRMLRKLTRASKNTGAEIREGRTYVSNIGKKNIFQSLTYLSNVLHSPIMF